MAILKNNLKLLFLLLFLNFNSYAIAEKDDLGSVCLGAYLNKRLYDPSSEYITISEFGPFYYVQGNQYSGPRLVIDKLDRLRIYTVRVHFKGQVVSSWSLNFAKLGTETVNIWRSAGAWRMDPIQSASCKQKP